MCNVKGVFHGDEPAENHHGPAVPLGSVKFWGLCFGFMLQKLFNRQLFLAKKFATSGAFSRQRVETKPELIEDVKLVSCRVDFG